MKKRILSILLAAAVLLSSTAVGVSAEETEYFAADENIVLASEGDGTDDSTGTEDTGTGDPDGGESSDQDDGSADENTDGGESSDQDDGSAGESGGAEPGDGDGEEGETEVIPAELEPADVKASNVASSGKVKLTWDPVEGAEKYMVYRATSKTGKYSRTFTTTGTQYTNTGAEAGKLYYYKVKAVAANEEVADSWSDVVSRRCDLKQPVAESYNDPETGRVKISWNSVSGAVEYKVYRSTSKNGEYKLMRTMTGTVYTNTSAEVGTRYYYKVKAIAKKSSANSAYSEVVSRTPDLPQPEIRVVANSKGKPNATWDAVPGAVEYKVYRATSKNGTYKLMKTMTGTSYTNTACTVGTTYYYKVKAIAANTVANSAYSNIDSCRAVQTSYKYLYSSYSTPILNFANPNYEVACNYVDGTIVAPGEEFSLNQVVGPRWESRGFADAPIILGGVMTTGSGGGLCQIATTLFNAALYANFDITDREQHSLTSAYVAVGRDAMMFQDSSDFRFINTSDYYIKISAKATNGRVTIKFYTRESGVSPSDDVSVKVFKTGTREYFTVRRYKGEPNYYTKTYYD